MITVTFTAATLFQGSMRSIGSTLSVTETDARVLVDIGVATAPGVTPQGGWPTGELSETFLAKADNLAGLDSNSTARTNLGLGGLATLNDAPSDGSQYARKNGAWDVVTGGGGGGGGAVDIQVFGSSTTSGTFTWNKPAGAIWVEYLLYGGGGGGGSGGRYATTSGRSGGGGGAGGGANWGKIGAAALNATETVVVGAGGTGGASRTTDTSAGNAGGNGGASTFKYWTSGQAPGGGAGGTVSGGAGQVRWTKILSQSTNFGGGGSGSTAQGGTPTNVLEQFLTATGGAGGSGAAANVTSTRSGSSGGSQSAQTAQPSILATVAGGTGGNSSTLTPGGNGVDAPAGIYFRGATGGGSGYYITGTAGGNGGNGGFPSGGGGGGGASDNGFNSGAGGTGGNGFVVIVTYIG